MIEMEFRVMIFILLLVFAFFLAIFGVISAIVYLIFRKTRYAKYANCFNWWLTLSFLLPGKMQKYGMKKQGIILMFLSPMALWLYLGIYSIQQECFPFPLSYDEIRYKTKDDIRNITAIENFPSFSYSHNKQVHSTYERFSNVYFTFDKELASSVEKEIIDWCDDEDNVLWEKDKTDDVKFFGDTCVYCLMRAWDGKYIKSPIKGRSEEAGVKITIGKKGFMLSYSNDVYIPSLERYERDSLNKYTGVCFPSYRVVYFTCMLEDSYPDAIDHAEYCDLLLEKKPSDSFIRKLKNNPKWRYLKSYGWYECQYMDGDYNISVTIDPESRKVLIQRRFIDYR